MHFSFKKFSLALMSLILIFVMTCGSFTAMASEDPSSEPAPTTAASGVAVTAVKVYGSNFKYYAGTSPTAKKASYSLSTSIPRWMDGVSVYISADKKATVSCDGNEFKYEKSPYDDKSYFHYDFEFDAVTKDKKRTYTIEIKLGDAKSTLKLNVSQTSRTIKFKFIKVNDTELPGSASEGYTVDLPSGTEKAKIKIRFVDEEKMTFNREGEDPVQGEISKAYQYYLFQPKDLEEGANVFDVVGYAGEKSVSTKLTINVGEVEESSEVSSEESSDVLPVDSEVVPGDEGSTDGENVVLLNGTIKQVFVKNESNDSYATSVIVSKGENSYQIDYNAEEEKNTLINLDAIENGDLSVEGVVAGTNKNHTLEFDMSDSGYTADLPLEQGRNTIILKVTSKSENPMKIYLGETEQAEIPSETPSSDVKQEDSKSPFSGALIWIIIAIVVIVIIAACIIMMSGANGGRRRRGPRDDDYDDYYNDEPRVRNRDIGEYIDDNGYDEPYDDGYYDDAPQNDEYYDDYDDGYYDNSGSERRYDDRGSRRGRRNDDYYDDRY